MFRVRFTATVKNFDTEEEFNGWVDPNWNRFELRTEREDVRFEDFDTREEAEKHIEGTIGAIDLSGDEETFGNYYGADAETNDETGEVWYRAGHIEEV